MEKEYIDNIYHRPADNYESDKWDMCGIAEDAKLQFYVGYQLVTSDILPHWNENSELRNLRN